jgi:hypothetical protein
MFMGSFGWLLVLSLSLQSLGEVAEREKERREANREAGVEATSYTMVGESIERKNKKDSDASETGRSPRKASTAEEPSSPLEEARERGKILEPRMEEIARAADRVDDLYQTYMDQCYGRYAIGATPPGIGIPAQPPVAHVGMGRNWFIVLDTPSAFTTPTRIAPGGSFLLVETPQCESLRNDLVRSAEEVRSAMRELLDFARREGILPGVVRDLREKYRLEWSGWER